MRINNNLAALNAWRNLTISGENMQKSLERLSSGYRINRAADDAAGLAVSEKMRAQIRGLSMALRNAQDGISLLQTAEGGAAKIQDMLQRMRELAVQASNGTLEAEDREQLNKEFEQLREEITRTAEATRFNRIYLLAPDPNDAGGGSGGGGNTQVTIQVGANKDETLNFDITYLTATHLSIDALEIDDQSDAQNAITTLDTALETVTGVRAQLGAYQNRLEATISTLQTQYENLTAAESRIRDVDMAREMAEFTRYQILQQAGVAMLAQANMLPQSILSLLR